MDWQELTLTILPVIITGVITGVIAFFVGRAGWFRNARKETAQKRLDEVLNPIKCEYDKVMTHLQVTGEPLFYWVVDYEKELQNLHEGIEKSSSFDILRTRNPKLFGAIEGFFRNLQHLESYEKDMGNDLWSIVYNSIDDDLVNQNLGGKKGVSDILFLAVVLNWDEQELMRRHRQKLHEILSGSEEVTDDFLASYVSRVNTQVQNSDRVKEYIKYRKLFLKQAEAFVITPSEQMERDMKLIPG